MKHPITGASPVLGVTGSIHPQGWVPVETACRITPFPNASPRVAFTPKGGCPLKLADEDGLLVSVPPGSIHPQGWVPVET